MAGKESFSGETFVLLRYVNFFFCFHLTFLAVVKLCGIFNMFFVGNERENSRQEIDSIISQQFALTSFEMISNHNIHSLRSLVNEFSN